MQLVIWICLLLLKMRENIGSNIEQNMGIFFYTYFDFTNRLKTELKEKYNEEILHVIIDLGLIIPFYRESTQYFFDAEVDLCKKLLEENFNIANEICDFFGYRGDLFLDIVKIGAGKYIKASKYENKKRVPAYIRNIIWKKTAVIQYCENKDGETFDLDGSLLVSNNIEVIEYLNEVNERKDVLIKLRKNDFANTSTYMGIKKPIIEFIIEAVLFHCKEDFVFLDLMCGSGSVANAFSKFGRTIASDSQLFCMLLAKIRGNGLTVQSALELLEKIRPYYLQNMEMLNFIFEENINEEANIFHMDTANRGEVFDKYIRFVNSIELYSSTDSVSQEVGELILQRKQNHELFPYCLCTMYFANIYFGYEQSFQLDSLRYAIEQIKEREYREWLIGVLIITASVIASNYGGHFAQPRKIQEDNIEQILEKRKKSGWLEFSRRLIAIAEESEKSENIISIVPGPWENAMKWFEKQNIKGAVVYLDAPYKREDYSRYYHVLETLARYDYPDAEYKSKARSLKKGERFRSEFATRNALKVESQFISIITRILKDNCICAWSYSNNGNADIMRIIDEVKRQIKCNLFIYAIDYRHTNQGKKKKRKASREIVEYCIIFKPL